jgi:hypothetical protein
MEGGQAPVNLTLPSTHLWNTQSFGFSLSSYPHILSIVYLIFFGGTTVWTQGFILTRHMLYSVWAMPSALFALVILETGSCFLPGTVWTTVFRYHASCHSQDDRYIPPWPASFNWTRMLQFFFLPRLA